MYYDREGYPIRRPSSAPAWAMVMVTMLAAAAFIAWLYPDILHAPSATPPLSGAVGNQAPPAAVQRSAPVATPASAQQSIDAYNAAEQQRAAQLEQAAPVAAPLPLNSAGAPVIDAAQQAQEQQSLQLAEQEGAAAADAQLAAQRQAANADALSRPPDVSYADAATMLHRDPCHVPHANPATCAQGLFKPTPVNAP